MIEDCFRREIERHPELRKVREFIVSFNTWILILGPIIRNNERDLDRIGHSRA